MKRLVDRDRVHVFLRHVHAHHTALDADIVSVETVDQPPDPQLAAYVCTYFAAPAAA